ncbi:HLA class II histocompatibility antigen, DM beta chain-like [Anas platyrhynchos]|uniref:HLA class II histocompatibility antigen, DM beta chain-like n=1 Tax=Anas platyrhynchos TaxID=8839 RepID=UPI003AF291F0
MCYGKPPGKQEREREDVQEKEVCAQPQVRIIPAETGNARVPVRLSCHIWGFYPPEVTVIWLRNGDIVEPDDYNPISAIPNGDWSYQTQVSLLVAPVAGDTYTCSVQHVSLQEPLLEDWSPGLMPEVTILVAVATVLMVLGLGLFLAGVYRFRARPPTPGYTPLPGDNYPAGNGVTIPIHIVLLLLGLGYIYSRGGNKEPP